MIGQTHIKEWVSSHSVNMPTFIVLVGGRGSGKKMLAQLIARTVGATFIQSDIKVDSVREVIDSAYSTGDRLLYCFGDADNMRAEAKNAMLKVTEEPPKNKFFVLTVVDESSLLDTIKSRAFVFHMEPYSDSELEEYYNSKYGEGCFNYCSMASTPYEVDMLVKYGYDFIDYVNLVIDNISEVEPANAFKSGTKLAMKNEEDKYDLGLFWRIFIELLVKKLSNNVDINEASHISKGILLTSKYLNSVNKLGVNKQQLYDSWVFEIREVWY